jgi:hypothetical protein
MGDNIKTNVKEMGCEDVDRIDLTQEMDRWRELVNMGLMLWFP